MSFATNAPTLKGPLALDAGEAAVGIGTKSVGALAQVSGIAAGFNVFTPTTNATYYLVVRGQDAATGAATNAWIDVLVLHAATGWAPAVISSTTTVGTPGARTWSNATGVLNLVVATGATWYVDVALVLFPA